MAVSFLVRIFFYVYFCAICVLADLPAGTKPGEQELVTKDMLKKSGKNFLMVLDVDATILTRYKPTTKQARKSVCILTIKKVRKSVCLVPGFPLQMDPDGNILECGIMRPGFTQFIMEAKEKFFLIIYTANDLNDARSIALALEDMYSGTKFEVRAIPHIHEYPLLSNGGILEGGGSKDLRNIMEEELIPLSVILEDAPTWYTRLPRGTNQLLCLIQVPKLIFQVNEERRILEVFYNDTTLCEVRKLLAPILNPPEGGARQTPRQILDVERKLQRRTNTGQMWI